LSGCSGDLGLGNFTFACEKDSDCGEGKRCDPSAGCVAIGKTDGGPVTGDGGTADRTGPTDSSDMSDLSDMSDGSGGGDPGAPDTGGEDTGGPPDAGGGFVLDWAGVYHGASGTCSSADYVLRSTTGWMVLPGGESTSHTLRPAE
jgi:hypothetical protein